jgi:hypothetical protein
MLGNHPLHGLRVVPQIAAPPESAYLTVIDKVFSFQPEKAM